MHFPFLFLTVSSCNEPEQVVNNPGNPVFSCPRITNSVGVGHHASTTVNEGACISGRQSQLNYVLGLWNGATIAPFKFPPKHN